MQETQHYNALAKGTLLDNKYSIQKVLGEPGGFGIAYLAIATKLDKKVVIKEFLPDEIAYRDGNTVKAKTSTDKDNLEWGLEKFKEEAQTLAKFNHPNIVKVLDFFEDNHTAYFVMDYEEGQDLDAYLKQIGRDLTQDEIVNIIVPILDGLKEVHSYDFLHRDIKPGNIYIRDNGSPMLIDFGAARNALGVKSKSITQILTPGYAPTEQYGSNTSKQGAFTDIYSIGAVLYKLVANITPIDAPDRSREVFEEENPDPLIPASQIAKDKYTKEFLEAIDWALEIRAKKRPQNVVEFRDRLLGVGITKKKIEKPKQKPVSEPKLQEKQNESVTQPKNTKDIIIGVVVILIGVFLFSLNNSNNSKNTSSTSSKQSTQSSLSYKQSETSYIIPDMIKIKAGSYKMGSNNGDSDEKPVHYVKIKKDFYIGKYEVTFKEYDKFCKDTLRKIPDDSGWGRGDRPVINVSYYDAKAYAKWLSKKTGKRFRLPTEAEWEYVARAGSNTKYSFGDSSSSLGSYAWYYDNSNSKTHKVGQKKPNKWGLYDMHGNVWEWCEDWYIDNYNKTPRDGRANTKGEQKYKVLRGGSWGNNAYGLRSANRDRVDPANTYDSSGFRLVGEP